MILSLFAAFFLTLAQAQTPAAAPASATPAAATTTTAAAAGSNTSPAADAAASPTPAPSMIQQFGSLPILVLMTIIFYFIIIRPQQKRSKDQQALVSSLKTGDRVVTSSGIYGLIANVSDKTVTVKIAEGVKVEMDRASVTTILNRGGASDGKVEVLPATKPAR